MDNLKRSIIFALAHIFPTQVTISQLSVISGYSIKSKYLYRTSTIKDLIREELLVGTKLTSNLQVYQLNSHHPLMRILIELCTSEGDGVSKKILEILKEVKS